MDKRSPATLRISRKRSLSTLSPFLDSPTNSTTQLDLLKNELEQKNTEALMAAELGKMLLDKGAEREATIQELSAQLEEKENLIFELEEKFDFVQNEIEKLKIDNEMVNVKKNEINPNLLSQLRFIEENNRANETKLEFQNEHLQELQKENKNLLLTIPIKFYDLLREQDLNIERFSESWRSHREELKINWIQKTVQETERILKSFLNAKIIQIIGNECIACAKLINNESLLLLHVNCVTNSIIIRSRDRQLSEIIANLITKSTF
eukprot:TRINITY_DN3503_c0_g4_i2.p1 TRINITY_DN3503_c0_g4~~TRINITY_DN3503_c0_g4_i2.p1  ORF type:complete len:265 (+),score=89.63 TRINITY_DN3503_c0_g4_i2:46-840(+)